MDVITVGEEITVHWNVVKEHTVGIVMLLATTA